MSLSTVDVSSPGEIHRPSAAISVAVDPVALVVTECITVTSAMRKHARWAHSSVAAILGAGTVAAKSDVRQQPSARQSYSEKGGKTPRDPVASFSDDVTLASRWGLRGKKGQSLQDNPLLSAFARLRSDLKRCKGRRESLDKPKKRQLLTTSQIYTQSTPRRSFIPSFRSYVPPPPRRPLPLLR